MTAAARFFNLVRPPIIIIETGQFAEYTYTGSYTRVLYRGSYTRVILCVYRSRSSSPEQLESISLCNFWPPRAHLHTEIGLYTHLHTHIYIYTHTDWNFTLPDKRFTTGKLASTCDTIQCVDKIFSLLYYNHLVAMSAEDGSSIRWS